MRLVSKFVDYYDWVCAPGMDRHDPYYTYKRDIIFSEQRSLNQLRRPSKTGKKYFIRIPTLAVRVGDEYLLIGCDRAPNKERPLFHDHRNIYLNHNNIIKIDSTVLEVSDLKYVTKEQKERNYLGYSESPIHVSIDESGGDPRLFNVRDAYGNVMIGNLPEVTNTWSGERVCDLVMHWLSEHESPIDTDRYQSDKEKIVSHGFDTRESFRRRKPLKNPDDWVFKDNLSRY